MVAKRINRNRNTNDESVIPDGITLNSTTTIKIADADPKRIAFHVNNNSSNQQVFIKLQAASIDNDKKGIFLDKLSFPDDRWEMPVDNIYTGEISAIAVGGTPTIYVTEY